MPAPSPSDRLLWERIQRRAMQERPELASAILKAFQRLRAQMTDAVIRDALASGTVDAIVERVVSQAQLDAAFMPVREQVRTSLGRGIAYAARTLPPAPTPPGVPPMPASRITTMFDQLNPRVVDAIRTMETKVVSSLQDDAKATVRQVVERGLVAGQGPKTFAKELRGVIGLGPTQEQQVANFRAALAGESDKNPLDYKLRDKRFDRTVEKARAMEGGALSEEQIEKMTQAYRTRFIAHNAETVARTASLDAMKQGQHLAVQDAVERGVYDGGSLVKTWRGVMDDRERPEHIAMEGETVPWDQPFSTGEMTPGSSTFNCRCVAQYGTRKTAG